MIQIGIIGLGRIGKVHAQNITNVIANATIKSVADPNINNETEKWVQNLGIKNVYKNYHEILNDNEIDAVLICSSTNTHSTISIDAAKANKHIFCEKPIDYDLKRINNVLTEVKKTNIKFQVGFNRRFDNNFRKLRNHVVSGNLGDVHIIKITSRDPKAPPVAYVKVSGGMFLDMTIHDFDMVRYLSGSEVDEVFAYGTSLVNEEIGKVGDIDTAIISMKLKNGAIAVIDNSREAAYGYDQRAEVFGSKGKAEAFNNLETNTSLSIKSGVVHEKPQYFFLERYQQSFTDEITDFIDAINNDTDVPVCGIDGLNPVLIGLAAQKSLKENRSIKISEMINVQ